MVTFAEIILFWLNSAERDWKTARGLFDLKRYDSCLFFCHLALEKILKGLVAQNTKEPVPHIHDLAKLASIAKLKLTEEQIQQLRVITTFNISARYDDIKLAFYKKCTEIFTKKHFGISKELFIWLKNQYQKM